MHKFKNGIWNWKGNYTVAFIDPEDLEDLFEVKEFDPEIFATVGNILGLGGTFFCIFYNNFLI